MASGIDWFRWHHGSVTDQKFQLVARKSSASVAEVIAVWATILEAASMSDDRGNPGDPDCEAIDCALGLDDGVTARIIGAMSNRGLFTEDGRIASWDKRQPKRERENDHSTDRVRALRARMANETPRETTIGEETPCNATERQETPREEKRREVNPSASPAGFAEFWMAYPRKAGKGAAEKAFRKTGIGAALLPNVLQAIERARATEQWRKDNGQFIPHPATWLNERRWEDDADGRPLNGASNPLFAGCDR
jgi:hypothetical protein